MCADIDTGINFTEPSIEPRISFIQPTNRHFPPSLWSSSLLTNSLCLRDRRYLVKNNLLAPVFALFRENGGRDNLINSAVIELVEVSRVKVSESQSVISSLPHFQVGRWVFLFLHALS